MKIRNKKSDSIQPDWAKQIDISIRNPILSASLPVVFWPCEAQTVLPRIFLKSKSLSQVPLDDKKSIKMRASDWKKNFKWFRNDSFKNGQEKGLDKKTNNFFFKPRCWWKNVAWDVFCTERNSAKTFTLNLAQATKTWPASDPPPDANGKPTKGLRPESLCFAG